MTYLQNCKEMLRSARWEEVKRPAPSDDRVREFLAQPAECRSDWLRQYYETNPFLSTTSRVTAANVQKAMEAMRDSSLVATKVPRTPAGGYVGWQRELRNIVTDSWRGNMDTNSVIELAVQAWCKDSGHSITMWHQAIAATANEDARPDYMEALRYMDQGNAVRFPWDIVGEHYVFNIPCPDCEGTGIVDLNADDPDAPLAETACGTCKSTGRIIKYVAKKLDTQYTLMEHGLDSDDTGYVPWSELVNVSKVQIAHYSHPYFSFTVQFKHCSLTVRCENMEDAQRNREAIVQAYRS